MTFRRLALPLGASVIALAILGVVAWLMGLTYKPTCGQSHPDYERYAEALNRLRVSISSRRMIADDDAIDLSELHQGKWKIACVFGGYTSPLEKMRALGASISQEDQSCWTEAGSRGFRLAQVEESEMAIAYADLENNAHFIHFNFAIGAEVQNFQECIAKPETRLTFATRP
jgi:hypothetical protein